MKTIIKCQDLCKSYGEEKVLDKLNFTLTAGEIVAINGLSGCGKSTLLNILGALDKFDSGELVIFDQSVMQLDERKRAALRNNKIGFVYQFHHLLKEFSALENIAMPLLIGNNTLEQSLEKARALLKKIGLDHKANLLPSELSGGQRQRVAIARAVATDPAFVLMDEPTGNLDAFNANEIMQLLLILNKEVATAFVIVTHNQKIAGSVPVQYTLEQGQLTKL